MASANSGSSFKVITPLDVSCNLFSVQVLLILTTTYPEAASKSLVKPFGMTAYESFMGFPALLSKVQGEI
jgi:hypothetical protein